MPQLLRQGEGLVHRGRGRVEPAAGQQVPGDAIEQRHRDRAVELQASGMPGAGEGVGQQALAIVPGLRIADIVRERRGDRGEGEAGPARFVAAEFGAGDGLHHAMDGKQAVGGFREGVLAQGRGGPVPLERPAQRLGELGGHGRCGCQPGQRDRVGAQERGQAEQRHRGRGPLGQPVDGYPPGGTDGHLMVREAALGEQLG